MGDWVSFRFSGSPEPKPIYLDKWPRKDQFMQCASFTDPTFSFTSPLDVSPVLELAKRQNLKASHLIMYLIGKTVNAIPEFKTRLTPEGTPVTYEKLDLNMTVDRKDGQFNFHNFVYDNNAKKFLSNVAQELPIARKREARLPSDGFRNDTVMLSCNPWFNFTGATTLLVHKDQSAAPVIIWGKYTPTNDNKTTIPVFVRGHHGLMDGRHMGQFFNTLQENINQVSKLFKSSDSTAKPED